MAPARYGIVGSGWRSGFFLRLAQALPDRFAVAGVVTRGADVERDWGVPGFGSVGALLAAERPDFVVVAVPARLTPEVVGELVAAGVPVLAETPPAPDLERLRALWADVGPSGLVQVAEQYLLMPGHAARQAVLRAGAIGTVTSAQVSSTHLYHAVSMLRGILGAGFAPATVSARAFRAPLVDPVSRDGWAGGALPRDAETTLATIDFGGRVGVYDFTDNQWHNPLRTNRIVVRGSLGELVDDRVVRLADPLSAVESSLVRRQTGIDLNLEGFDLDHIGFDGAVVYRNPFAGARLADEEIAIATLLERMVAWRRDGAAPPYPLAEACQDHLIGLAIAESAATGAPVTTAREPWTPHR